MKTIVTDESLFINAKTVAFDDVQPEDIPEIISEIEKNKPKKIVIFAHHFTGDNLKLLCHAIAADNNISWIELRHPCGEKLEIKDEDFSFFLNPTIFEKFLYPMRNKLICYPELSFILKSEERTTQLLENKEISNLFKSIIPDTQSFPYSCAAFSIMELMYKDTPDFNLFTELSIYKEIWQEPGEIANPVKIKNFLEKNGYDVDLIVQPTLAKPLLESNEDLKNKFGFFKGSFNPIKVHEEGINETNFKPGTSQLLIVNFGSHVIRASRIADGKVLLCDPTIKVKTSFKNLTDFVNSEKTEEGMTLDSCHYTGVSLGLNK